MENTCACNNKCCDNEQIYENDNKNNITMCEIDNACVYPSDKSTVFVKEDDEYNGAHEYIVVESLGFSDGVAQYGNTSVKLNFVKKTSDGSIIPGLQSEQLVLILLDRVKKLNAVYPDPNNIKQIEGLTMFLDACKARIDDRINRGVMGQLKK